MDQVIVDYDNLWLIWEGTAYRAESFGDLMHLEQNFLEAVQLETLQ